MSELNSLLVEVEKNLLFVKQEIADLKPKYEKLLAFVKNIACNSKIWNHNAKELLEEIGEQESGV